MRMMNRPASLLSIVSKKGARLAALLLMAILVACSGKQQSGLTPQQMTVPVVVGKVVQKDVPVQLQAVGTAEALNTVSIKPQIAGILSDVHFREGQNVKKGDLLFTIDPRPFQANLAQAQANLAKDVAQAKTARGLSARYENLVKKDYVTKEEYDQVRTSAEALEASADADRAAVENAKLRLEYCTIRSPIEGRTGNLMVHAGNVLKENETVLVEIHQMDPIYVRFFVPEENLANINKYNAERKLNVIVTPKSGAEAVSGTLSFIDNEVNNDTGTILLKGTFDNKRNLLWPGEFINVTLTLATQPNAIVVPSQAVESGQNGQFIFVVKPDMTAEMRPVVVGFTVGQETVIQKGVQPGETVVTDGQLRLLPGAKVEIKNEEGTSS